MIDQTKFADEKRIRGEFGHELGEQLSCVDSLMLALASERQPGLRERLQIMTVVGRALQLLHSTFPVTVNPSEPQESALVAWQASDDVVCRAQRHVGILGGRIDREQFCCLGVS